MEITIFYLLQDDYIYIYITSYIYIYRERERTVLPTRRVLELKILRVIVTAGKKLL